ncbi:MAG: Gfo/Idh/MocA family oxidoreductase [Sedimentisphaerales bacterium]|nr:Gfo/Idh/MocA family oxidoreductase [Sedimentisphaerales bacterium]
MPLDRRRFLQGSVASALALPSVVRGQGQATYRTALIGCGWWGTNIVRQAIQSGACRVVGLCDVDRRQVDQAAGEIEKLNGDQPRRYKDYRELLEKEKPQIAIVATPDHWHPLITIAACRAGADVYVEKPICHTIQEGRAMVDTARATGRVVQVGTHRRVSPHNVSGREFLRSGKAGRIGMVRCFVHYGGEPEAPAANEEPPAELDWDLWCGPAPLRPFNRKIHPKGFRNFLDYGNGQIGDWGIHWLDQVLWIMEAAWPKTVYSHGGRVIQGEPVNTPQMQTSDGPDHQVAVYEFDEFTCTWEHRRFAGNQAEKGENVGCYFYGTQGTFHMGWQQGWTFYPADGRKAVVHEEPQLHLPDQQNIQELWTDFLDCVKSRRRCVCDIEIGHRSTSLSLLAMLSMKIGRSIRWDGRSETVVDDPEANRHLRRAYRSPWKYPEA